MNVYHILARTVNASMVSIHILAIVTLATQTRIAPVKSTNVSQTPACMATVPTT